mgnify:CR=1 FL=1
MLLFDGVRSLYDSFKNFAVSFLAPFLISFVNSTSPDMRRSPIRRSAQDQYSQDKCEGVERLEYSHSVLFIWTA